MYAIPILLVVMVAFSFYYIFRNGHSYFQLIDQYIESNGKDDELLRRINKVEDVSIVLITICIVLGLISLNILSHENLHSN